MISYSVQINRGTYTIYYRVYDKSGKLKQHTKSTGLKAVKGNKRKANEFAKNFIQSLEDRDLDYDNCLFADYVGEWIARSQSRISITTYDGYISAYKNHIKPYFTDKKLYLKDVKPLHIEEYCNDKILSGLSPNSVLKHYAIMRTALQDALKNGYILKNPAELATKPKKIKPKHDFYTVEELKQAFKICKGTDIELPVFFACFFGLRRSEAIGLKWEDVDFENRVITIQHTAILTKGKIVFRDRTKTEASNASLPISDEVWAYLKHVKEEQDTAPKITDKYKDYVCVNRIGDIVKPEHVTQKFPKLMEQNNMKHICFHGLRHSCISLIASSNNMKITQTVARHSNYNTTADIYSHITDDRVATALQGVVNAIGADLLKTS